MSTAEIQRATLDDVEQLASVVAAAFFDLPPSAWLVHDREARASIFRDYFALYVEHGIHHGVVHTTADRNAAAIWVPISPGHNPSLPDYDARLAAVTGGWVDRFRTFDATLDKHHPTMPSHHWLAILAVTPEVQDQGIGTALMEHYHQILDEQHHSGYLEAANERDRDWYQHRGWQCLGEPFALPDGGPSMWPMWRYSNAAKSGQ